MRSSAKAPPPFQIRSGSPQPGEGHVHLWWIDLEKGGANAGVLSEEERTRAARLRSARDRLRYIAAHAAMRSILGYYLAAMPASLVFKIQRYGKPVLDPDAHGPCAPAFSLSCSADLGVLALASAGPIGVDVETHVEAPERAAMLDALAPIERAAALELGSADLVAAFRIAWTRKEACVKAVGTGFTVDPAEIEAGLSREPRRVYLPIPRPDAQPVYVRTMPPTGAATISVARLCDPIEGVLNFQFDPDFKPR